MARVIEAVIDEQDNIRLLAHEKVQERCRALVIILDGEVTDTYFLKPVALAEAGNRAEENAAG